MTDHTLGKSSLRISRIGFGCMSLKSDEGTARQLIPRALDLGINYFDTADLYEHGENERIVGKALGARRHEAVLATKVGNRWHADGSGWDWDPRKAHILQAVEQSLRRLDTDYIDLYQLHGGTMADPLDETVEAFELLQQQGKIRCYGISSIRPDVIAAWAERSRMASVMMQYSLLDRRPEEACLNLLMQHGISVVARGSLAQGLLAGKEPKPYLGHTAAAVAAAAQAVSGVSDGQRGPAAIAIGYVLRHPAVASAVVGIRTGAQLDEAVRAASFSLPEEQAQALQASAPAQYYAEHR